MPLTVYIAGFGRGERTSPYGNDLVGTFRVVPRRLPLRVEVVA